MEKNLDFLSYGPAREPAKRLVILLHGYGRDASLMEKLALDIGEEIPHTLILCPQAPELCDVPDSDDGNALRVPQIIRGDDPEPSTDRRQWFTINGTRDDLVNNLAASGMLMNGFIDRQRDALALADRDIALMGFSQGGGVALYAALMRKQTLGCLAAHSTPFFPDGRMIAKPPTLYLYGTEDEEFPEQLYRDSILRLQDYMTDLTIEAVPGLSHRTSDESRRIVAGFIKRHMAS